jgi:hypothetical protein
MARARPDVVVHERPDGVFDVEVRSGTTVTTHEVTVPDDYPATLACEQAGRAELVAASFAFLLEREPATSILRRFRLPQIAGYFPEYPEEISRYLG